MKIIIDDKKLSIEQTCKSCGVVHSRLSEGKGPHAFELRCTGCGTHTGWVSKIHAEIINAVYSAFEAEKVRKEKIKKEIFPDEQDIAQVRFIAGN